jgi:hypothetical protein
MGTRTRERTMKPVRLLAAMVVSLAAGAALAQTGPCDVYAAGGTPCIAAHSTVRALYAAYAGSLYRVRRSSDNTTRDIPVLAAGGYADASVQDSFCANTTCVVTIVFDQSGRGNHLEYQGAGSSVGGADDPAVATRDPLTVAGHKVYSLFIQPGNSYWRNGSSTGVPTGAAPEGMYMVTSGTHVNNGCCFDYGNSETTRKADAAGAMDAINFSTQCWFGGCSGSGPWVQADLEWGLYSGGSQAWNPGQRAFPSTYVTATLKNNGTTTFAIKGANAQSGGLTTLWNGNLPSGYSPMKKQGAIILGSGGDCCATGRNLSAGTFYEGAMVAGYPSDATENAVQANIVAAGYGAAGSSYALSVGKAGAGTVTSTPGGISCGSICSANYASGTTVTLTAATASGAAFAGWSGACTGTGTTCTVSMTAVRSVTATFTGSQAGGPLSLNAGGAASGAFVADAYFSGGSTYSVTTAVDTSQLSGAAPPQSVLQTERYGEFTYTIPGLTAGAPYSVTLLFDEVYWTAAGQRTFDVAINGATVLSAFDIFAAAGGANRAVARTFDATAGASGQIVVAFTKGGGPDNPKVCAVTIATGAGGTSTGRLLGLQSNRCLDVPNRSQTSGTRLSIWDCNGGTNQQWTQLASGAFQVYGTRCLEFPSGAAAGTQVQIGDCTGAANQQWRFNADGTITSVSTGLCLDVSGQATANGSSVVVWTCNGGQNQRWSR